jgi:hypothetical protein
MDRADVARWDPRIGSSWVGGLMTNGNGRVDASATGLLLAAGGMGANIVAGRLHMP